MKPETMARHGANRAVSDERCHPRGERFVPVHEALFDDDAARGRGGGNAIDIVGVEGQRLFTEHVLAGFDRRKRPSHMLAVWERDVDGIDAVVV